MSRHVWLKKTLLQRWLITNIHGSERKKWPIIWKTRTWKKTGMPLMGMKKRRGYALNNLLASNSLSRLKKRKTRILVEYRYSHRNTQDSNLYLKRKNQKD